MNTSPSPEVVARLLAEREWLRALARRISGDGESEDLAQDTWVAALEHPPGRPEALRPWIAGVVRHLARGLRRTRARRSERERRTARGEALPSTVELVERVDTEHRLTRALLELDEPYRTTLLLRFHEGLSSAEIARRQHVPEGTVRWRCKAGLDELRARLARELGGREALGVALARVAGRAGKTVVTAGAASAARATAVLGNKAIVVATTACAAGLAGWFALARQSGRLAPEEQTAGFVLEGASGGAVAGGGSAELEAPVAPPAREASAPTAPPTTSPPASVAAELARFRILGSDGRPHAGHEVVLEPLPGETSLLAEYIDDEGWVDFPASGARRRMAVERFDAFPFRTEIELTAGDREIRLPVAEGEELAGSVLVDGAPPERSLCFLFYEASSEEVTVDTDDLRCLLADVAYGSTDARGRFRFRGLASERGYNLRAPGGHARPGTRTVTDPDNGAVFHFDGPATDVRIELERHARVRGRVVEADGVTPIEGAEIEIAIGGSLWRNHTQAGGTFEIFTRQPPADVRARFRRASHDRLQGAERDLAGAVFHFPQPQLDTDLGDLVLTTGAGFFLDVRDAEGRPLAGAEAGVSTGRPTNATDASGRTWVAALAPGTELAVTRRGYRTAFVVLPAPVPETMQVALVPANDLTLELRGPGGELLPEIQLELSAAEWFLATSEPSSEEWESHVDTIGKRRSWWRTWSRGGHDGYLMEIEEGQPVRVRFHTRKEGRVSLGELQPGLALHLTVRDDTGLVLHEQEIAGMGPEERRVVTVQLETATGELRGRVVTASGEPIPDAQVYLGARGDGESRTEWTGDDGRFRFRTVGLTEFRLAVARAGFLPLVREPVRPGAELELVLERAPDVTVRVRSASGRPIAGGTVRARRTDREPQPMHEEDRVTAERIADGLFELRELPQAPHEVVLELPEGVLRQTWEPPASEVEFWVPGEVGTVQLAWRHAPEPAPAGMRLRLEARSGGNPRAIPLDAAAGGEWSLQQFAGEYELVLELDQAMARNLTATRKVARKPLTVVAGATVRIELP